MHDVGDETSDEQLLDRYFLGEAEAFKIFFNRHQGRVFAYAKRKGLDPEHARELSQEAFLRLHRSIHHYESGRPALTWFFTIVHNCVIDALRKAKAPPIDFLLAGEAVPSPTPADDSPQLEALLSELSDEQRQVLHLRAVEELSFKEIAEITGKSDSTLRKLFERTRKALKQSLSGRKETL